MKRSQMIKVISNEIMYETALLTDVQSRKIAEVILNEIELQGMLPPFVDGVKDTANSVTLIVDQAAYAGRCEWDPE